MVIVAMVVFVTLMRNKFKQCSRLLLCSIFSSLVGENLLILSLITCSFYKNWKRSIQVNSVFA